MQLGSHVAFELTPSKDSGTSRSTPLDGAEYGVLQAALAGQYTFGRELGRGGMGVVFLGRDVRLDRPVAVKVLPPHLAEQAETRERFLREARTAAQLSHPNIVPVYRADEVAGHPFFVMGYIEGESLAERVRERGPLPLSDAVRIVREVAWALAYAHSRGVIHRDVKPENVMVERGTGRAMVTDFGIARDVRASRLTEDGFVLGTVHFMSPEQVAGDVLDGRSDLYALGVVAFHVLSGRLPFEGVVASAVLVAHATRPAPPLRSVAPQVPERLASVIDRCLAKDPADRFATGEELADALGDPAQWREPADSDGKASIVVSESEAGAIWRRAAQLQAEASQRLEKRLGLPAERLRVDNTTGEGYRLDHVTAAAIEAGINSEYVALAVSERPAASVSLQKNDLSPLQERVVRRLFRSRERSISASRVIAAAPRQVLAAIGTVFQGHPYDMKLRESVGGHPLDGGIMLFDVPRWDSMSETGPAMNFKYYLGSVGQRQLRVTLHALSSDQSACEVAIYADLRATVKKHARWAIPVSGVSALGGAGSGYAAGLALLGGGLALLPALVAGAMVGAGAATLYGMAYRYGLRKAAQAMEQLLADLDAGVKGQSLFGTTGLLPRTRPTGRRDDNVVIIA